jgi:hypothetical protein
MIKLIGIIAFVLFFISSSTGNEQKIHSAAGNRLQPSDLEYLGAFRLPDGEPGSDVKSWLYGGTGMTYYPGGDASGPDDGFPGSLFAVGHDWEHQVSEITIPVPIIPGGKNLNDLNTASTLQGFHDIMNLGSLEMPRSDIEYLPPQGSQAVGKIYFCRGAHLQGENDLTHGWFNLNLSNPQTAGLWRLDGAISYSVSDYLFEIPESWASVYTPGKRLAAGRFRDGGWSGQGPAIYAIGPWNQGNPPPSGTVLQNTVLLQYTSTLDFSGQTHTMTDYHHSDEWSGGAWVTAGTKSAVIFAGTKGFGNCWYGFGNGVVWPENPPYPPIPAPPYNERGWWSNEFRGRFIFYDPDDLADVASGEKQPWEPQPYASMDVDSYLFSVASTQQKHRFGAMAFDRARGYLYVMEYRADEEKCVVHVWKVKSGSPGTLPVISLNRGTLNFGAVSSHPAGRSQTFTISNTGGGTLNWNLSDNVSWLTCTPVSGGNSAKVTVTVDSTGLVPGQYNGVITIQDAGASNSPREVSVVLTVYEEGGDSFPFGVMELPQQSAAVSGGIPVTGWALDDIAVESVKIYMQKGSSSVFIGDAVWVEGVRPDIEGAYPGYPNYYKSGWGYMMLTNFLPQGGNGEYTIYAAARDTEGHETVLGTRTVMVDNAHRVKPFGTIDTPGQGGEASGKNYLIWGWVLTPSPNYIPYDGSTIEIYIDGVSVGHPAYNIYRSDIASLFTGYMNSNGAVGYFYLDTTGYSNGLHTIQWVATDSAGNSDGIGSRYFIINN